MRKVYDSVTALALLFLLFFFAACSDNKALTQVDETIEDTSAVTDSSSPKMPEETSEEQIEATSEFVLSDVTGVYLMNAVDPQEGDPIAYRLELLGEGDKLGFLLTSVFSGFEDGRVAYILKPKVLDGVVSAVYDDKNVHVEVSSDGQTADVGIQTQYYYDKMFNGRYERQPFEEEYQPKVVPAATNDPATPDGAVDAILAKAVRIQLELPGDAVLTQEHLSQIQELEICGEKSVTLNGIEYFTNLREIFIQSADIRDISPLAKVSSIERISFDMSFVETIPDFSKCENLKLLSITNCLVSDISPITKISSLKSVMLMNDHITSVAPIKDMNSIEFLSLQGNPITDWETIADNPSLIKAMNLESLGYSYEDILSVLDIAREMVKDTITEDMSELEKEIAIYKKVQEIADYAYTDRPLSSRKPDCYYILVEGRGVCTDFSYTISLLMTLAGIECYHLHSNYHMWNIVKIDGEYFEIDCTYDDTSDPLDWQYFNVSRMRMESADDEHRLMSGYEGRFPGATRSMMRLEYLMTMEDEMNSK